MRRSMRVFFGALAAAVTLAACNNGNNSSNIPPGGGTNCGNPPYNMEVIYPKPNAKKVIPNVEGVVVAFDKALPSNNQYDLIVNQSNGQVQYTTNVSGGPVYGPGSGFTTIAYSKIPSPHATPTFPNPQYYVTLFQPNKPIGPAQAVDLYWNDAALACTANVIVSSFSTN